MNLYFGKAAAFLAAAIAVPVMAFSQDNIRVRVNGDRVHFDGVGAQEIDGRVMVPLRGVLEKLGAFVDYDESTQTVTANRHGIHITMQLGHRHATVNGQDTRMDVPAQTLHGSTMVPLRFIGEALGADVRWDADSNTVIIDTTS